MNYRAEIDGLRALAVLPVILFHAGFEWFSGGFVGVDVFFVISGYLITTIIISEMAEDKFSIVNFYERRARRILPALFFVMAACLPFAWLWLSPNDLKDFGQSLVAVTTFTSNILFWFESGYFDTAAELKPLLHTWSLMVEEQYYILFPIFLMFTWRLGVKWILVLLSIVFFISLSLAVWGTQYATHPKIISGSFFLLPTRGWELLIGVFVAFYLKFNTHFESHNINQMLSLVGLGMISYSIITFDKTTPFPSLYTLIPTIGTGLLILCAVPKTLIYNLLSQKYIVGMGLISYSAYLWHQPLLAFARHKIIGDIPELYLIILCIIAFLMAWFSWRYIEKPFRNRKNFSRSFIIRFSIICIFLFSLIGTSTHFSNGFINRLSDGEQNILQSMNRSSEENCEYELIRCLENIDKKNNKSLLLIGDSNAYHFSVGLSDLADELSYDYVQLTLGGCMPLAKFYRLDRSNQFNDRCISYNNTLLKNINDLSDKIDVVIVSSAWLIYFYGKNPLRGVGDLANVGYEFQLSLDGVNEIPSEQKRETFSIYLNDMFSLLSEKSNNVIIVGPLPPAIINPQRNSVIPTVVKVTSNKYFNSTTSFNTLLNEKIANFDFAYIDIASELCNSKFCKVSHEGMFFYSDDSHLSDFGQSMIMTPLLRQELNNLNTNELERIN